MVIILALVILLILSSFFKSLNLFKKDLNFSMVSDTNFDGTSQHHVGLLYIINSGGFLAHGHC
jgi:hypothetical protein